MCTADETEIDFIAVITPDPGADRHGEPMGMQRVGKLLLHPPRKIIISPEV